MCSKKIGGNPGGNQRSPLCCTDWITVPSEKNELYGGTECFGGKASGYAREAYSGKNINLRVCLFFSLNITLHTMVKVMCLTRNGWIRMTLVGKNM